LHLPHGILPASGLRCELFAFSLGAPFSVFANLSSFSPLRRWPLPPTALGALASGGPPRRPSLYFSFFCSPTVVSFVRSAIALPVTRFSAFPGKAFWSFCGFAPSGGRRCGSRFRDRARVFSVLPYFFFPSIRTELLFSATSGHEVPIGPGGLIGVGVTAYRFLFARFNTSFVFLASKGVSLLASSPHGASLSSS